MFDVVFYKEPYGIIHTLYCTDELYNLLQLQMCEKFEDGKDKQHIRTFEEVRRAIATIVQRKNEGQLYFSEAMEVEANVFYIAIGFFDSLGTNVQFNRF